jgi:hypothetical protein
MTIQCIKGKKTKGQPMIYNTIEIDHHEAYKKNLRCSGRVSISCPFFHMAPSNFSYIFYLDFDEEVQYQHILGPILDTFVVVFNRF